MGEREGKMSDLSILVGHAECVTDSRFTPWPKMSCILCEHGPNEHFALVTRWSCIVGVVTLGCHK